MKTAELKEVFQVTSHIFLWVAYAILQELWERARVPLLRIWSATIEVFKTAVMCGICYLIAIFIVWPLWPVLRDWSNGMIPADLPEKFSECAGYFIFFIVTHMQRQQLDPKRVTFKVLYAIACLLFALSTVPPTQYNAGTARSEIAFVLMLCYKIIRKDSMKTDQDEEAYEQLTVEEIDAKILLLQAIKEKKMAA